MTSDFLYPVKAPPHCGPTHRVTWLLEEIGYGQWKYDWNRKEFLFKTEENRVKFILKWL